MRFGVTLILYLSIFTLSLAKNISLYDYGLIGAKSGEERFWVLYNAHADALKKNYTLDYSGIRSLDIEIPANAKSIPVSNRTDFQGMSLQVTNNKKKDFCLFVLENQAKEIKVAKRYFSSLDFSDYPELRKGTVLLVVHDDTPWVKNRIGFNYGAMRYDILLLNNGRSENNPISSYYNEVSIPRCSFVLVTTKKKYFRNINFYRTPSSTQKTFLLRVKYQNNIELNDIKLFTPKNEILYGDHIISLDHCTNVSLKRILVDNTYSKKDKFGYAFSLNNVWNTKVSEILATAPWGVFVNSNVNKAVISKCNINRFDLHCYGRDYYFDKCVISSGIPIGSFLGTMSFKKCTFRGSLPCYYRYDYNSYHPFNLEFDHCTIEMDNNYHCFMYYSQLSNDENSRPELRRKSLPNITIKDCDVMLSSGLTSFDIIYMGNNYYQSSLSGINYIKIKGLNVTGVCDELRIITNSTKTESPVTVSIRGLKTKGTRSPQLKVNLKDGQGHPAHLILNDTLKR